MDYPNLSAIDRASFLGGLQLHHGEFVHCTASSVYMYSVVMSPRVFKISINHLNVTLITVKTVFSSRFLSLFRSPASCQTTKLLCCLGNPMHSTAMEEDLNVVEEGRVNKGKAGRKDIPRASKTTVKQRGAAVKRKETERDEENEEEEEKKKRSRRASGGKVGARYGHYCIQEFRMNAFCL